MKNIIKKCNLIFLKYLFYQYKIVRRAYQQKKKKKLGEKFNINKRERERERMFQVILGEILLAYFMLKTLFFFLVSN